MSSSDTETKASKSISENESDSSLSLSSDPEFTIKTNPKKKVKLDKDQKLDSKYESLSESPSPDELNLGSDSSDSKSDSSVESDDEQNSDSESDIDTNLGTSSFDIEPSDSIEKIIGINQPTFSEQDDQIMYFVKYRNQSYRSCQWITEENLLKTAYGKQVHTTFIKNPTPFKKVHFFSTTAFELFKPLKVKFDEGFIIPERILSVQTKSDKKKYLVKWISLDISKSTWETDVPDNLVDDYLINNMRINPSEYEHSENGNEPEFNPFTESPMYRNFNKLFDFQVEGLNFVIKNWFEKRNSALCDSKEMGRTIESIAVLEYLSKIYHSWGPFVVVCPYSSVNHWINEFENWTEFRVVCLTDLKDTNDMVKKYLMFHHIDEENKLDIDNVIFDVLIVSYESLPRQISFVNKFNFMFAVFDEAQRIKNYETYIYQNCMSIKAHRKLLLTGDLDQFNSVEIWSFLHFVSPSKFADYEKFEQKYKSQKYQDEIKKRFFVRNKSDIDIESSENEENIVESEMTNLQRDFAQTVVKNHLVTLPDISASKMKINNFLTSLHKILCHPFLVPELESDCLAHYKELNGISKNSQLDTVNEMNSIITSSGKMILFDKLIHKLKEENHKILVFSSMKKMLDIIENYLILKEYLYERLDGSYSVNKRAFSIERFQRFDEVFIILLSPESGGIGVDLTGADTVVIYDGEYDPRNDILAQSSIHEDNKSKSINVIRLTTSGCYESEVLLNDLSSLNFESNNQESFDLFNENKPTENDEEAILKSKKKIQMILRKSCYHIFNDNPDEIDIFMTQDIEKILENRSHSKEEIQRIQSKSTRIENRTLNKENFWDDFLQSESSYEDDDFDFNTGIKPRTNRKEEVKDEDEYDFNNKDPNDPNDQSSSSSSSDSSFSLSDDENSNDDDESSDLFDLPDLEKKSMKLPSNDTNHSSELYTISALNQSLFPHKKQGSKSELTMPKFTPDSSDIESVDSSDEMSELKSTTTELSDSIVMKIFTESLDIVRKHGIAGARLFTSETMVEIGKSLVVLAFSRLSKREMKKYKGYIHQHIPKMSKQILKTPYKEMNDEEFISALFGGNELQIIKDCFHFDKIYRVALFVSTEKLPEKFSFAPEMPTPLGWTAADDFILLTASLLFEDISEIADDERLPFKNVSKSFKSFKKWIKERVELIVNETAIVVPSDFSVYSRMKGNLVPKKFCDVKIFKNLNNHVICQKRLPISFQKKLLRVLYLYGFPKNDGVSKIKKILRCNSLQIDDLICIFIEKVVIESAKIKPNLIVLLKSIGKVKNFSITDNSGVDIRWIKKEAIVEVAKKMELLYKVREKFDEKVKLNGIEDWTEIEDCCKWWSHKYDKNLFKATACYGFLFNSMLCDFIPKLGVNDIDVISKWREDENEALEPLMIPEIEEVKDIFSIELREKRILQILEFLQSK